MKRIVVTAGIVLLVTVAARGQEPLALTFEEALRRARESAPAVVTARLAIEEARGHALGARLPIFSNPVVELEQGRRSGDVPFNDYGVAIAQDIDLPQRRTARIAAATAAIAQEEQRARDVERELVRDVARSFLLATGAREQADAAERALQLAEQAVEIAERRFAAGDVAQLDVNLARTAVVRARTERSTASAAMRAHVTSLQVLLGIDQPLAITGPRYDFAALDFPDFVAEIASLPQVRILDAAIAEAEADLRLGRTLAWPEFGVRIAHGREEGDRVTTGGVGISLPMFNRGQAAVAVSIARLARLRSERDALMRAIEAEVRGAFDSYETLRRASVQYQRELLPLLEENERLALESYDVGQIGFSDLLLVRREVLDARRALIDQLIATRLAEVALRTQSGVWQ